VATARGASSTSRSFRTWITSSCRKTQWPTQKDGRPASMVRRTRSTMTPMKVIDGTVEVVSEGHWEVRCSFKAKGLRAQLNEDDFAVTFQSIGNRPRLLRRPFKRRRNHPIAAELLGAFDLSLLAKSADIARRQPVTLGRFDGGNVSLRHTVDRALCGTNCQGRKLWLELSVSCIWR
jgi:hypothetical protein